MFGYLATPSRPPGVLAAPRGGSLAYAAKILTIQSANALSLLNLAETSGGTAADATGNSRTGAYNSVTLNATAFLDGTPAPSFDGTTSWINWFTSSLAGAINLSEGTFACWVKASAAGVWTDGVVRVFQEWFINSTNKAIFDKHSVNNQSALLYNSGSLVDSITAPGSAWASFVATWSISNLRSRIYLNGSLLSPAGVLSTAASGSIASISIGRQSNTSAQFWSGNMKYCGVWSTEWAQADVTKYNTVP